MPAASPSRLAELREQLQRLDGSFARTRTVLPFMVPQIDQRLPGGGLALNALHEVAGGADGAVHGAAAALFCAGIAARTRGKVLWCITRADLFAPAVEQAGLGPDRVVFIEAGDDTALLSYFEEGLAHGGLGAVVGEVAKLPMVASRRLQHAAEKTGTLALAIRRWRRTTDAADFGQPTASVSRWRVSALPSEPLSEPGLGRARWLLELIRIRAGASADFIVESCDAEGRLALPADLGDGQDAQSLGSWRALS